MTGRKYGLGLAAVAACMAFGTSSASAAAVEVLPSDVNVPGGEWSTSDTRAPGTGLFETGPKVPPLGTGSFEFTTSDATAKVQLFTNRFKGTALSAINGIGYSTFRDPGATDPSAVVVPSIQLPVDRNGNTDTGVAFSTIVYEPYFAQGNGGIKTNAWQEWDAFAPGAVAGGWYVSGATNGGTTCAPGVSTTCTLAQVQAQLPNAKLYAVGLNQGTSNAGAKANADALYVSLAGQGQTTFDFESEAGPAGPPGPNGTPGTNGSNGTPGTNGTNGTNGAAGSNGSNGTPSSTSPVKVTSRSLKANRKRQVKVGLSCPKGNGLCEGSVRLVRSGKVIARQAFIVRGGRSGKVTLTLSRKAYKALGKSKKVSIAVFSRDLSGAASTASKKVTLKK